jgi:hypothetical protein
LTGFSRDLVVFGVRLAVFGVGSVVFAPARLVCPRSRGSKWYGRGQLRRFRSPVGAYVPDRDNCAPAPAHSCPSESQLPAARAVGARKTAKSVENRAERDQSMLLLHFGTLNCGFDTRRCAALLNHRRVPRRATPPPAGARRARRRRYTREDNGRPSPSPYCEPQCLSGCCSFWVSC